MQWDAGLTSWDAGHYMARRPMPKHTTTYQYSIRFSIEQLDLVSRLMARTGLNLVSLIRFALSSLADKLGEPIRLSRAGETAPGPLQQAARPPIGERTTDSDPELELDF
jgi:hypothetical protein